MDYGSVWEKKKKNTFISPRKLSKKDELNTFRGCKNRLNPCTPTLIIDLIPTLNKSIDKNICPSVMKITFIGI